MQKTKLGISVGFLGAAIYFLGLFSGYLVVALLVGYVLLFEQNEWLRKCAVKAITLMLVISFVVTVINLIPNSISFINSVFSILGGSFSIGFITSIINAIVSAIGIIEKLLFLGLGLTALNMGTIAIPAVDKLVNKCFE